MQCLFSVKSLTRDDIINCKIDSTIFHVGSCIIPFHVVVTTIFKKIILWKVLFYFILVYCIWRAAPIAVACGGSQAQNWIRVIAASLHHSHSNARSKLHWQPTPHLQQHWIADPLSEVKDWTHILLDTSWICFHCVTTGTPIIYIRKLS